MDINMDTYIKQMSKFKIVFALNEYEIDIQRIHI
jgi:hypothetical protein